MIRKTSNSRFQAVVKSGRSIVATKVFTLKRDAETWHDMQKRALELGSFVDPKAGKETLGEVLARWQTERFGTVSSKTHYEEGLTLKRLPQSMTRRAVSSIRTNELDSLYADILRGGLSRSTVLRFRNTLSSFFGWAVRQKIVRANPVLESAVPRGAGTAKRRTVFPFTIDELYEIVAEVRAKTADKDAADIVLFLGLTGIRWGELSALRVRDVAELPSPALLVTESKTDGHATRTQTKGGAARTVPLLGDAQAIALSRRGGGPNDLLFPNARGGNRSEANFKRAVQWSKVSRGRRLHDLRHSAASNWLSNGVDVKAAQAWLGHSTATLTLNTYGHWMPNANAAALERMNAVLSQVGGAPGVLDTISGLPNNARKTRKAQ